MQQECTGQNTTLLYPPIDGETVAETKELHNKAAVSLKKRTKVPPRSCAVVDVDINTTQHR